MCLSTHADTSYNDEDDDGGEVTVESSALLSEDDLEGNVNSCQRSLLKNIL